MTEILTSKMKNDTTRMFFDDVQLNNYYVFVSSITSGTTRQSAVNSQYYTNELLENTLFGKKILGSDTKFMIKFYDWQKDAVYVQYDDKEDMDGKRFYAIVSPNNNDTGDYRVFKCLSNNNGSASTAPPNWNPENTSQVYRTADGYVWKFLYVITSAEFEAYNAIGYVPLIGSNFVQNPDPNADANNVVYGSEISDIFVSNPIDNNGYKTQSGTLTAAPGNDGTLTLRSDGINQITNYYNGMSIYLTNSDGRSFLYVINSYVFESATGYGKAKVAGDPLGDQVSNIATFTISPTCVIDGDGTGAVAVSNVIEGNISSLLILNAGSGYTNVTARIVDPLFDFDPEDPNSIDIRADLRPILSPMGGHGYNLIDELHCKHILFYGYITETDNNQIGKTGTYSHIAVVKNPSFASGTYPDVFDNRIEIETDDIAYAVTGDTLQQFNEDNEVIFKSKIQEVDANSNTVFLSNYMGPYQNAANNDVSIDQTKALVNSTGQRMFINTPTANNIIESDYIQRTGQVYFMEDFVPLARTFMSREEYKLVLEF